MLINRPLLIYALTGISFFLSACAPPSGSVTAQTIDETVKADLMGVYQNGDAEEALTVEDVLARALRFNLDTKVAEFDELIAANDVTLETLSALPSVTGKVQRVGRNNRGGSSSFSLLTGLQSLQPSISSDQYRTTQQLNMEWNLLEAGIALTRARSASDRSLIAQERRRKVYHGVVQDAYASYWRVAAAQMALPMIDDLLAESALQIETLDDEVKSGIVALGDAQASKTRLLEKRKLLTDLKERLFLAEVELKTLIDYPLDQPIALNLGRNDWLSTDSLPKVDVDIETLEATAFANRPEVREEILNKRVSTRDIKLSILETIPGIDMLLSYNRDSNSFLANSSWADGTLGLTQSITKIFTLPARYDRAKNVDLLSDKRRQALMAAILTQLHVSKARYDFLAEMYSDYETADAHNQSVLDRARNFDQVGMISKPELLNIQIDASISSINKAFAYANVQDSYGRLINTLGVDLWDADNAGLSIPDFAEQIRKNLSSEQLFAANHHAAPDAGGAVAAASAEATP